MIQYLNKKIFANPEPGLIIFSDKREAIQHKYNVITQEINLLENNREEIFTGCISNIMKNDAFAPMEKFYKEKNDLLHQYKKVLTEMRDLLVAAREHVKKDSFQRINQQVGEDNTVVNKVNQDEINLKGLDAKIQLKNKELGELDTQIEEHSEIASLTKAFFEGDKSLAKKTRLATLFNTRAVAFEKMQQKSKASLANGLKEISAASNPTKEKSVTPEEKANLIKTMYRQALKNSKSKVYAGDYYLDLLLNALENNNNKIASTAKNSIFYILNILSFNLSRTIIETAKEVHKNEGIENVKILRAGGEKPAYYIAGKDSIKTINMAMGWVEETTLNNSQLSIMEEIEISHFYKIIEKVSSFYAALIEETAIRNIKDENAVYPHKVNGKWVYTEDELNNLFGLLRYLNVNWRR